MNYADIKPFDIANGPGVRVSLFVSGCTHHCKGCFNEETWDFNYGKSFTRETIEQIIKALEPSYIWGLSLLGGEPFERPNQLALLPLVKAAKEAYPQKDIWCYSGYTLDEDILKTMIPKWPETAELLSYIDILVDGEFVEEKKDLNLRFKGSTNQRIIKVKDTLESGSIVLWDDTPNYQENIMSQLQEKIQIKKLNEQAIIPTYGSASAAGADLYACIKEAITFAPGETILVPTGLSMAIPIGYAGLIYARSGLATKKGLAPANKVGVVDADYRGEVMVPLHNHSTTPVAIEPNERIAQLIITPFLTGIFEETCELDETERGTGGFGSTGSH